MDSNKDILKIRSSLQSACNKRKTVGSVLAIDACKESADSAMSYKKKNLLKNKHEH